MKKIILIAIAASLSTVAFAQKFAHINSQEVFQLMPEMDTVRIQMDAVVKENQNEIKSMYEEYQAKVNAYQQKVSTWTPAVKESKEKELAEMESRIQETQQNIQSEMQAIQNNLTAPVMKKCQDTISELARKAGYIYVFDISSALYIDPAQSVDMTAAVRKALGIAEGRTLEDLQRELAAKQQAAQ